MKTTLSIFSLCVLSLGSSLFAKTEPSKNPSSFYSNKEGPKTEGMVWVQVAPGAWVNCLKDSRAARMIRGETSTPIARQKLPDPKEISKIQELAVENGKLWVIENKAAFPQGALNTSQSVPPPEPPKVDYWTTVKILSDGKKALVVPNESVLFVPAELEKHFTVFADLEKIEPKIRFPGTFPDPFKNLIVQVPSKLVISPEGVYSYVVTKEAFEAAKSSKKIVVSTFNGEPMMITTNVVE